MPKVKHKPVPVKKIIWRMSGNSPLGEYVSSSGEVTAGDGASAAGAAPDPQSSWKLSSVDLLDGLQVSEQPMDTLPGELVDEFFKR